MSPDMSNKIILNQILEEIEKESGGDILQSQNVSQSEIEEMLNQKNDKKDKAIDHDKKR